MQFKYIIVITLYFLLGANSFASDKPKISLLTCSSGEELYSSFGHTAIRVQYPDGADTVFNFGMFDFHTPHFYIKFACGNLNYMLDTESIFNFEYVYQFENRDVIEQTLHLNDEQTRKIIDQLRYLNKPENRFYAYRFSSKNCTTEPRDLIFNAIGRNQLEVTESPYTVREILNSCLSGWAKLGVNIILGSAIDKKINQYQSLFLPQYLLQELNNTSVSGMPLVAQETTLIKALPPSQKNILHSIVNPVVIFTILLMFFLLTTFTKRLLFFNTFFQILLGIIGLIILLLTLFSKHPEMGGNFNLLWCNPLYLLLPIAGLSKKKYLFQILFYCLSGMLILTWIFWIFCVQYTDLGMVLLSACLALSLYQTYSLRSNSNIVMCSYGKASK